MAHHRVWQAAPTGSGLQKKIMQYDPRCCVIDPASGLGMGWPLRRKTLDAARRL